MKQSGFTLIELLLVIGIISVLAAIVIVAVNPSRQLQLAGDAERHHNVNQLLKAIQQYQIDRSELPGDQAIPVGQANALPICRSSYADAGCINMDLLVPDFLGCLPRDSAETNALYTGYRVYRQGGQVLAESAYLGATGRGSCEKRPEPIAYWKLDEGNGTTTADSSNFGHNGTLTNMDDADWMTDAPPTHFQNPYALDFDGVNDYMEASLPSVFSNIPGNDFSVSFWFKGTILGGSGFKRLLHIKSDGSNDTQFTGSTTNNELQFGVRSAGSLGMKRFIGPISPTIWHHVVGTWDASTSTRTLYVDSVIGNSGSIGTQSAVGNSTVNFARRADNTRHWNGLLDDIRIYNTVLESGQVFSLANGNP